MRTPEEYKEVLASLEPYTTLQEKNALLKNLDNKASPITISKMLGGNPSNDYEAYAFVLKMREISVSDIIEMTYTCGKCNHQDFINHSIPDMFFQDVETLDLSIPISLYTSSEDLDNIEDINNMTIEEYDNIESTIHNNNIKIFNPEVEVICKKCGHKHVTNINPLDFISKSNISNIYEQYLDISYYSNMTKSDTDNMYPFEREIFIGLIQKKEDEKGEKKPQNK